MIELVLVVQAVPSTSIGDHAQDTAAVAAGTRSVTGIVMLSVPEPLRPDMSIEPWFDSTVAT